MANDKIKEVILNLLNRTTANGCTEGEAATALAKAQQLLAKHNLTMSDLSEEETRIVQDIIESDTKSLSAIQVRIATNLASHFGVALLKVHLGNGASSLKVVAEQVKSDIFKEVFVFTYKAFKYNWSKVAKSLECSTHEKNLHRGSYLDGFISGLISEIERKENETALVVTKSKELTEYMESLSRHLHTSYYGVKTSGNDEIYSKGYNDGVYAQRNKNHAIA